jgi:hypothetical protein
MLQGLCHKLLEGFEESFVVNTFDRTPTVDTWVVVTMHAETISAPFTVATCLEQLRRFICSIESRRSAPLGVPNFQHAYQHPPISAFVTKIQFIRLTILLYSILHSILIPLFFLLLSHYHSIVTIMGCKQSTPVGRQSHPAHNGVRTFPHKKHDCAINFSLNGHNHHDRKGGMEHLKSAINCQTSPIQNSSATHNGWMSFPQQMAFTGMETTSALSTSAPSTNCDSSPSCSAPSCCDM